MMDLGLQGRTAAITGASMGIGKGIALALAREGVDVAICARGKGPLEDAAKEIATATGRRVVPVQADMTELEQVKSFVATSAAALGRLDILVYCANSKGGGSFADVTDEAWQRHLDTKFLGCVRCVREVIPHMRQNQWGRIVIISGMAARITRPYAVDNGPVCAALANFGKQIAAEIAGYGIRVNTIHPDGTLTPRLNFRMEKVARQRGISIEKVLQEESAKFPIGRMLAPEDIAQVALFLCSKWADPITGQSIAVDGGSAAAIVY